jgi:DNA-binding IclR family transcriptional regulator
MEPVERAFFLLERCREIGRLDGSIVARFPGWDRVKAHRYLTKLASLGYLERISEKGRVPIYVLGRKLLSFSPDMRLL